jgi:hypothetical protein
MKYSRKKKNIPVLTSCLSLAIIATLIAVVMFILHDKYDFFSDETPLVEETIEEMDKRLPNKE